MPFFRLLIGLLLISTSAFAKEGTTATADALRYVKLMVSDRTQFTKDYILTNKYLEFQGE